MAVISFGPLVDAARGSIGGVTFQRGPSGNTVRAKPRPPTPNILSQRQAQDRLVRAIQLWRLQTTAVKADWLAYAATVTLYNSLSNSYHPTAAQAFAWCVVLQQIHAITPLVLVRPTSDSLPTSPTLTIAFTGNTIQITAIDPAPAAGEYYMFQLYRPDIQRTWPRTHIHTRVQFLGATALPWILAANYKNLLKTGTIARAHVHHRLLDTSYRTSCRLKTYLDFVST